MPAAAVLSVGGSAREMVAGTLHVIQGLNGRSTLRAGVRSLDGSYIPDQDDEVELEDDSANVLFRGLVSNPDQKWLVPGDAPLITTIQADDFTALADRRLVTATTTGGVVARDAVDYLVTTYLATYGVTRDAGMGTGGTLGALTYRNATVTNVLNDITRLAASAGWVWRIDEGKVLTAFAPGIGVLPCPWSITAGSPKITGDITITRSREHYANRVILDYKDNTGAEAIATAEDTSEQTAHGIYEAVVQSPGPFDSATAQAVADAYLARLLIRPLVVKFLTLEPGAKPGQTLTINLPARNLNTDFLITDLEIRDLGGQHLQYGITAVEGGTLAPSWKDTFRQWSGSGSGLVIPGGGTIIISTGAEGGVSLGGASAQGLIPGSGTYERVVNAIPFVATRTGSALVRVELWAKAASVSATARLRDLTTSATTATSSAVTSQTPTLTSFAASLVAGRRYELQLTSNTAGAEVYGLGSLVSF